MEARAVDVGTLQRRRELARGYGTAMFIGLACWALLGPGGFDGVAFCVVILGPACILIGVLRFLSWEEIARLCLLVLIIIVVLAYLFTNSIVSGIGSGLIAVASIVALTSLLWMIAWLGARARLRFFADHLEFIGERNQANIAYEDIWHLERRDKTVFLVHASHQQLEFALSTWRIEDLFDFLRTTLGELGCGHPFSVTEDGKLRCDSFSLAEVFPWQQHTSNARVRMLDEQRFVVETERGAPLDGRIDGAVTIRAPRDVESRIDPIIRTDIRYLWIGGGLAVGRSAGLFTTELVDGRRVNMETRARTITIGDDFAGRFEERSDGWELILDAPQPEGLVLIAVAMWMRWRAVFLLASARADDLDSPAESVPRGD